MSPLSGTSSSEEELEHGQPKEDGSVGVVVEPISITTSTPVAASSTKSKDGTLKRMLQMVLEAVRKVPSENQVKGISIQKIKTYLKEKHGVRKKELKDQLRPTLESAIKRKMLLKTAGRASVLIGSVKLNPAYREAQGKNSSSTEESGSSGDEPAVEEKRVETKKRKAVKEPEAQGGINKRRK
ncbi:uncharacterized protein LOC135703226 [Ochlerotatus camptorhynchus]|uniref:uncharacterized protein LOC135703226 n=1 Tax=Ochlerotatus camptorhynchus TaxID=644619 RepID=UPI0031DBF8B3